MNHPRMIPISSSSTHCSHAKQKTSVNFFKHFLRILFVENSSLGRETIQNCYASRDIKFIIIDQQIWVFCYCVDYLHFL